LFGISLDTVGEKNVVCNPYDRTMTRGNQRDLARAKNQKKQQELKKAKGATDKDGNKGMSLEQRAHRDAELMRLKQQKAAAEKEAQSAGGK